MIRFKQALFTLCLLFATGVSFGQDGKGGIGGLMRSQGRSYVVIAVMLTILLGIVLYLVRLERKINKLERE